MNFLLTYSQQKPEAQFVAQEIRGILEKNNVTVFSEHDLPKTLSTSDLDFIITCGGDGTILEIARKYVQSTKAPIVGVNLGKLGFLADIHHKQAEQRLQQLIHGEYSIEKRSILQTIFPDKTGYLTINDAVLHRGNNRSLIELEIEINGNYLNTFKTDGYIVATATGATAYSLAAGGPLVAPSTPALTLTPICPHTLSNRPLVVGAEHPITIRYVSPFNPIDVTVDGIERWTLHHQEAITIRPSEHFLRMVSFPDRDYFTILREKLHWKGSS